MKEFRRDKEKKKKRKKKSVKKSENEEKSLEPGSDIRKLPGSKMKLASTLKTVCPSG